MIAQHPEDYAIVVGINHYPALCSLIGAESDAIQFIEWLRSPEGGGVPISNIRRILSSDYDPPVPYFEAQPIKRDIDKALDVFGIGQKERVGRRLYFYFSGHGLSPNFDEVVLLMANAACNRLNSNLGIRKYQQFFCTAAPFDQIVFFLDCCRDLSSYVEPMGPEFTLVDTISSAVNVQHFVVLAADYGRPAFEVVQPFSGERRGILTQALLEGLQAKRAVDDEGFITAASLGRYLRQRVPELARQAGHWQRPEFSAIPEDLQFGSAPVASTHTVHIRIVTETQLSGDLILYNGTSQQIAQWRVTDQPWDLHLKHPGLYYALHTTTGRYATIDTRLITEQPYVYKLL